MSSPEINSIATNFSLRQLNTFGLDVFAKYYFPFDNIEAVKEILSEPQYAILPGLILGGGSNILFMKNFDGLVLHPLLKGIKVIAENSDEYIIKTACGENWDEFAAYAVLNNWCGIENLSGIPGNVGACPVQNIGAYGVEVKDVIHEVEALHLKTFQIYKFSNSECKFGYRDSIFKNELKKQFLITHVTFNLKKKFNYNLCYGDIEKEVTKAGDITLQNVRNAVLQIRASKLPDPLQTGNAGSFFKNPIVSADLLKKIMQAYENVPHYKISDSEFKLPAGWLIDQCGWKGFRSGNAGVHEKQALVLVNHGKATGQEILQLADRIIHSVKEKFSVLLSPEVNII